MIFFFHLPPKKLLTGVPITKGKGRMTSGVKKRISSFLTERRSLRNAILKGSGGKAGVRTMDRAFEAQRSGGGGRPAQRKERDRQRERVGHESQ